MMNFTIVVTGGISSYTFPTPISGRIYHRQINPATNTDAFSCYFQNSLAIAHDVHTGTGLCDFDDQALLVNETGFFISGTNDTYTVTLWIAAP
jgi:hypothetical protein